MKEKNIKFINIINKYKFFIITLIVFFIIFICLMFMNTEKNVNIMDDALDLKLMPRAYTSTDVNIVVRTKINSFSYLRLPNGERVESTNYIYTVSENGEYTFEVYDKKGNKTKNSITVDNIDKESPEGSCSGFYKDGISNIVINASDNVGVEKYGIEGLFYTNNNIVLDKEISSVDIVIYDNAGNNKKINCNLIDKNMIVTLNKSQDDYTNSNIDITINVQSNYFEYLNLPNGERVNSSNYIYTVSENGEYVFRVYDKDGNKIEKSIIVNNIDREVPKGSCSGFYKDGISNIIVDVSDNVGINNYVINGISYTSNNISLFGEFSSVKLLVYDKANNVKTLTCSLVDKNEVIISDSDITFTYNYYSLDEMISYGLFTPSSVKETKKTPLIIWLHGSGEVGVSKSSFKKSGFLKILNNWELDGFNAYVLCPQLVRKTTWSNEKTRLSLESLIDKIIVEKNIDTNKIILVGHSLGAQGVQYMAAMNSRYSSLVVLSGYSPWVSLDKIDIPVLGYVGTPSYGEDSTSYNYMMGDFKKTFGSDNLFVLKTSHGNVPKKAFVTDENGDNKSDLIEWMLTR